MPPLAVTQRGVSLPSLGSAGLLRPAGRGLSMGTEKHGEVLEKFS